MDSIVHVRTAQVVGLAACILARIIVAVPVTAADATLASRVNAQPSSAPSSTVAQPEGRCLDLGVPVSITLTADDAGLSLGSNTAIHARIEARRDLVDLVLLLRSDGPVTLLGDTTIQLGSLAAGETTQLDIPVQYAQAGRSTVFVDLTASVLEDDDGDGGPDVTIVRSVALQQVIEKHEALYMIFEGGRATSGMAEFLNLDLQRLEEDLRAGRITQDQAEAEAQRLATPAGRTDTEPHPFIPLTDEQEALSEGLEPSKDPDDKFVPDDGPAIGLRGPAGSPPPVILALAQRSSASDAGVRLASAAGTVSVHGTVSWTDESGTVHPVFGMTVQVRD
jgi:hypothetical protein